MSKKVENLIILILFSLTFYSALVIGSPIDEPYEMTIGQERLKYLFTLGSYTDFDYYRYEKFYPGLYNTLAIFVTKFFPQRFEIVIWHSINSICSIFTVFGIYKITSILFNKQVGKIVFLLCFLNPIFFGHMAMNSKDTIVALAHVWFVYITIRYLQKQNLLINTNYYVIVAGLLLGLGTGVRLQFFATLFPWVVFILFDIFYLKKITNINFVKKRLFIDILKIVLIGYFFAIFAWSYTHSNILLEPYKIFIEQYKFNGFGVGWLLYNGNFFNTLELPKTYILVNLFYKTPEFVILGLIIFLFSIFFHKNFYSSNFNLFFIKLSSLIVIIIFPILIFIVFPYRVYDGLRLFFYIIPYINILPALAIYYIIRNINLPINKIMSFVLAISFFYYLFIFIFLTPYQYTYLNKFTGSSDSVVKKFENDYWGISIKELIKNIPNKIILSSKKEKIKFAFCGINHRIAKEELDKIKGLNYGVGNFFSGDYDYAIMNNRSQGHKNKDILENVKTCFDIAKGSDLISVKRNGVVLSTIRINK